ncbi:hypothetical protein ACWT_3060 [Actinoplanes sp. SE50]|uniref:hypothetical protein n=1 Tax=unclassified Actinoplanes TaxID=2626549 RepID=UPI00023EC276|nr:MULTISPECIES: hypothetical protein [unclassified Actinoplanes]AEV84083.1 hypothetical protein ACPL_3188 [Actinoplanes sp. SE50/110]ATO82475.1 hypothetical protein ACWT_3060 [Actinoplanes sp. SE50]SLL99882.1 hypothetical protein ACSP50_3114 [Actinoplanes sp. SE50/110]
MIRDLVRRSLILLLAALGACRRVPPSPVDLPVVATVPVADRTRVLNAQTTVSAGASRAPPAFAV